MQPPHSQVKCDSKSEQSQVSLAQLLPFVGFGALGLRFWVLGFGFEACLGLARMFACPSLTEHEVVRTEQLAERSSSNTVHGACRVQDLGLLRASSQINLRCDCLQTLRFPAYGKGLGPLGFKGVQNFSRLYYNTAYGKDFISRSLVQDPSRLRGAHSGRQ